jgi:glutaredoxin
METIGSAGHTTSEYVDGTTLTMLSQHEAHARDLLKRAGIKFELIDLSDGIGPELTARLKGIRQTPTLLDGRKRSRPYVGIERIRQYIAENQQHGTI